MTTLKQALDHRDAIVDVMQADDAFEDLEAESIRDMIEALMRCGFIVEPAVDVTDAGMPDSRTENYRIIPSEIRAAAEQYVRKERGIGKSTAVQILEISLRETLYPPRIAYGTEPGSTAWTDWLDK